MPLTTPEILIYSTPTCPDCRALKAWLASRGLPWTEKDMSDPAIMAEAKMRTGVRVAPVTLVGNQIFHGTFASQKPRLVEALGLADTV